MNWVVWFNIVIFHHSLQKIFLFFIFSQLLLLSWEFFLYLSLALFITLWSRPLSKIRFNWLAIRSRSALFKTLCFYDFSNVFCSRFFSLCQPCNEVTGQLVIWCPKIAEHFITFFWNRHCWCNLRFERFKCVFNRFFFQNWLCSNFSFMPFSSFLHVLSSLSYELFMLLRQPMLFLLQLFFLFFILFDKVSLFFSCICHVNEFSLRWIWVWLLLESSFFVSFLFRCTFIWFWFWSLFPFWFF